REEIEERVGEDAEVAVLLDGGGAAAFTEPLPIGAQDEGEMGEDGRLRAERAKEKDVLRRVRQMIVATRNVSDLRVDVVDHNREVVRRIAVGAQKDEVIDHFSFKVHVTADQIVKVDWPPLDFESDDMRAVARGADGAATTGVAICDAGLFGGHALCLELLDGAVAAIRLPRRHQLLGTGPI